MSESDNTSDQAAEVLLSKELLEFCQSDSLSEEGLRGIVEHHGLKTNNHHVSDYEFFHRVCANERVTEGIIRCLLEYFPDAITATGDYGASLLHFACGGSKNMTRRIIQLLIDAAPYSVRSANEDGETPLHYFCDNKNIDDAAALEILKLLVEKHPEALRHADNDGCLPVHIACRNPNVTLKIIQLLVDAAPDSVRSVTNCNWTPLHYLCSYGKANEAAELEILKLLIQKHHDAVRRANNVGCLPIHLAGAGGRSPEFCRVLIEAYPGSERMTGPSGLLPFHFACLTNTLDTVQYLYKLYPDAINLAATDEDGYYPIHYAIMGVEHRDNPIAAVGVVKYLLESDPNVKFQEVAGEPAPFVSVLPSKSLLYFACEQEYNDSNIDAALEMIKIIYDAHPEAIEHNEIEPGMILAPGAISFASDSDSFHRQVQAFINTQLAYSRQAKNFRQMMTPDDNGRLPLHSALQNNVRLGSIKLLVKGNPSAIRTVDTNFALPLHVACQHHESTSVVQYLLGLDMRTLRAVDYGNNTALHYACRGAKYEIIAMLLEKYGAVSVSKQNGHGKLPIDLLWESSAVEDRGSIEYTESVFQLLRTYPEMVVNCNGNRKQPADADANQNGKKRNLDAV